MPTYRDVNIALEPYQADHGARCTGVFIGASTRIGRNFGKLSAADSIRQVFFLRQLRRLAENLGSEAIPVYVRWAGGQKTRMDKGCIGHALAAGHLSRSLGYDPDGTLVSVRLSRSS